jgi:hypothetical protein
MMLHALPECLKARAQRTWQSIFSTEHVPAGQNERHHHHHDAHRVSLPPLQSVRCCGRYVVVNGSTKERSISAHVIHTRSDRAGARKRSGVLHCCLPQLPRSLIPVENGAHVDPLSAQSLSIGSPRRKERTSYGRRVSAACAANEHEARAAGSARSASRVNKRLHHLGRGHPRRRRRRRRRSCHGSRYNARQRFCGVGRHKQRGRRRRRRRRQKRWVPTCCSGRRYDMRALMWRSSGEGLALAPQHAVITDRRSCSGAMLQLLLRAELHARNDSSARAPPHVPNSSAYRSGANGTSHSSRDDGAPTTTRGAVCCLRWRRHAIRGCRWLGLRRRRTGHEERRRRWRCSEHHGRSRDGHGGRHACVAERTLQRRGR